MPIRKGLSITVIVLTGFTVVFVLFSCLDHAGTPILDNQLSHSHFLTQLDPNIGAIETEHAFTWEQWAKNPELFAISPSGWTTYTDDQLGVQMSFPPTWSIGPDTRRGTDILLNPPGVVHPDRQFGIVAVSNVDPEIQTVQEYFALPGIQHEAEASKSLTITLGGKPALFYGGHNYGDDLYILLVHRGHLLFLAYGWSMPSEELQVLASILDTIHFF